MRGLGLVSAALVAIGGGAVAAAPRDSLGVFERWGAFREARTPRCYAIAEPVTGRSAGGTQPFVAVGYWPRANVRGQVHVRLSRNMAVRSPVTIAIGERRFALVGRGADAWATDRRMDAAIVAAMRLGSSMSISARAATGGGFADSYALKGAATAIDAAALGCGRLR